MTDHGSLIFDVTLAELISAGYLTHDAELVARLSGINHDTHAKVQAAIMNGNGMTAAQYVLYRDIREVVTRPGPWKLNRRRVAVHGRGINPAPVLSAIAAIFQAKGEFVMIAVPENTRVHIDASGSVEVLTHLELSTRLINSIECEYGSAPVVTYLEEIEYGVCVVVYNCEYELEPFIGRYVFIDFV